MTRDEVNAPIDPPLNREQVMMATGAFASRDRARQFVWGRLQARRFTRRLFRPCL